MEEAAPTAERMASFKAAEARGTANDPDESERADAETAGGLPEETAAARPAGADIFRPPTGPAAAGNKEKILATEIT